MHHGPVTPPQYCPTPRELDDLELLVRGALGEGGFGGPGAPVTLALPREIAEQARSSGSVVLVDPEGVPLAEVGIQSTYDAGSGEPSGGTGRSGTEADWVGIAGPVTSLSHNEYGAFRDLYRSPADVRAAADPETLTVPVAGPLTDDDLISIREKAAGRPLLLLALAGHGTPSYAGRPLSGTGLVRATLAAARLLDDATVVAVPFASRGPGAAEIDHALGERVVAAYAVGDVLGVTGVGELPLDVAEVISFEVPTPDEQGLVVFFTGLSGSGKSTLARALHDVVLERGERTVTSLDGDVVRRNLSAGLTFSKADRETNIRRIGWVAAEISRHRGIAIVSPIAPFDATRKQVRAMVEAAGGAFFLIHVATPVEECERRDRKGLYARARRGEIPEFTGISSPYEVPTDADVRVDTTGRSIDEVLADILTALDDAGYLPQLENGTS